MPKESTILLYNSSVTGNAPSSGDLSLGEMAINTMDEKVFLKNLGGNILSLSQTKDLSGAFAARSRVVTSVNGATGNIVSIATTGSNVFTGLNTFNAGLSAANLFVSGGATFGTSVSISGGTAWHSLNDGKGSGLDADLLRGINGDRYLEEIQTGLLYGGVLSINAGNTGFNVSAGAGIVVTVNASLTGFPSPTLTNVTWNSFTGQSVLGLTSGDFTFVRIDSSGNLQQSTSDFTQPEYLNSVVLGNIVHPSRSDIDRVHSHPIVAYASSAQYETFIRYFGPLKVSGYAMSGFGTTGQVQVSSGVAFALGANMMTDPNNPSVVTDSASVPLSTFYYLYRNADGSYKTDPTTSTIVNFGNYDDGDGTLGTISNNNWSIQRVYKIPGSDVVYVYYGRNSYSTSTTATAALLTESFDEADITLKNGVFLGWLIVRGGGSNVSSTDDCVIVPGGFFRNTTGGGGAATISSLDDLSDVEITSPSSNQILRYDGTQGLWVNSAVTTLPLVTSINGLTGAVQVTGSGAITQTVSGTTTTLGARLATTSVTGVASFNSTYFSVASGAVSLASAYQVTGDTVVAGTGIGVSRTSNAATVSNTGVLSFNDATGAISYAPRLATTGVTGVAHFPSSDFAVSATGSVTLSNVARTNAANTFSARQTFSAGITTSNLFVSTGATFGGNISAPNIVTSVNTQVGDVSLLIENLDVDIGARTTDYALVWDNGPENHVYKPISSLVGNYVTSVNGATGAVTVAPAGITGYIQYHTGAGFSADNGLQYDSSSETFRVGSGLTHTKQYSTIYDNFLEGYGSNLRIRHATGKYISIGDNSAFGAIGNGTYILVSDNDASISLYAQLVWTRAPSLFEQYATFDQYVDLKGGLRISGSQGTNGQLLTSTGSGITWSSPTNLTWSVITADQTAAVNTGYLTNKGTLLTLTLPTTAAVGSTIRVSGMNAGLWKIAQNASQVIHFGKTDTTTGTGGYLQATQARDTVELVCVVANNEWNVVSSIGNIDYA